jgi:hypothetical protein
LTRIVAFGSAVAITIILFILNNARMGLYACVGQQSYRRLLGIAVPQVETRAAMSGFLLSPGLLLADLGV